MRDLRVGHLRADQMEDATNDFVLNLPLFFPRAHFDRLAPDLFLFLCLAADPPANPGVAHRVDIDGQAKTVHSSLERVLTRFRSDSTEARDSLDAEVSAQCRKPFPVGVRGFQSEFRLPGSGLLQLLGQQFLGAAELLGHHRVHSGRLRVRAAHHRQAQERRPYKRPPITRRAQPGLLQSGVHKLCSRLLGVGRVLVVVRGLVLTLRSRSPRFWGPPHGASRSAAGQGFCGRWADRSAFYAARSEVRRNLVRHAIRAVLGGAVQATERKSGAARGRLKGVGHFVRQKSPSVAAVRPILPRSKVHRGAQSECPCVHSVGGLGRCAAGPHPNLAHVGPRHGLECALELARKSGRCARALRGVNELLPTVCLLRPAAAQR